MDESTPLINDTTNNELLSSVAELNQQLVDDEELATSSTDQQQQHTSAAGSTTHRHQRTLSFDLVLEKLVDVTENLTETIVDAKDAVLEGIVEAKDAIGTVLEEEIQPVKPRKPVIPAHQRTKLSATALSILVFYKVSGGPFGCEPTVRAAGPLCSLVGFAAFPLVWSLQEALVTAELGSAYPEPSGAIAWIEEAFGAQAGLLCGYFHWISGATDNAIYPSLMLEYISSYMNGIQKQDSADAAAAEESWLSHEEIRFPLAIVITSILAFISFRGLDIVGSLSSVVCVISMSPFVLLCIFGLPHIQPSRWMVLPVSPSTDGVVLVDDDALSGDAFFPEITFLGILWRPFINNLFWNLNSFDVGASFAGEVHNPGVVFPKAMMLSLALVWLSYVLPLLVALGASDSPQEDWKAGHLTVVAQDVVGGWLAAWTVLAAAVSNIALFLAEMSGDAYQLMGMADRGLIPKVFCKRSRFDTPTNGILLGTMVIFCLSVANFDALVEMLNFAYSFALLMEFAAFVKLRIDNDEDVERPFRLPFGTFGCILFVLPSCLICILIMVTASKMTYLYIFFLVVFGAVFQLVQKAAHHHNWWEYVKAAPKNKKNQKKAENVVVHA